MSSIGSSLGRFRSSVSGAHKDGQRGVIDSLPGEIFDLGNLTRRARYINERQIRASAQTVPLGDSVLCRVLGRYKMFVSTEDYGLSPHLMLDGYWEMSVTESMLDFVRSGMVALDVGAHLGYYSMLLSDLVGPEGRVISFEPNPKLGALLDRSISINGFDHRTRRLGNAVSSQSGETVTLNVPHGYSQNASVMWGGDERSQGYDVVTTTLDEVVGEGQVDFIKIDVEGSEKRVWEGMQGILARKQPLVIILEFNPDRFADPRGFLDEILSHGFAIAHIRDDARVPATPDTLLQPPLNTDRMLVLAR